MNAAILDTRYIYRKSSDLKASTIYAVKTNQYGSQFLTNLCLGIILLWLYINISVTLTWFYVLFQSIDTISFILLSFTGQIEFTIVPETINKTVHQIVKN